MQPSPFPVLDRSAPHAIAHRGGPTAEAPENTWAAFERAVRLGFDFLETDVRLTRDGVLVAFHDPVLDRVTDRRGPVRAKPWSELRTAVLGDGHGIPRVDELLAAWPEVRWNLDPKHPGAAGSLASVLRDHDAVDRVCVTAFNDLRLRRLRRLVGPRLCTNLGPGEIARLKLRGHPSRAAGGCVQVPERQGPVGVTDAALVERAHEAGLQVHVWTVNDRAQAERLLDLGVDGLMSDDLEMLRDLYRSRGIWPTS